MFRKLFTLLLLGAMGWCSPLLAQTDYDALSERLADYGRLTKEMKIDSFLDFIDPELFEIVPRPMMKQTFEQLLNDSNMRVDFTNFTVDSIGESVVEEGTDYLPVYYHMGMKFFIAEGGEYYEEEVFDLMSSMIAAGYADGEVAVDKVARTIDIHAGKTLFAIRRGAAEDWYFIEYNKDNLTLLDMLVPASVRERLSLN